MNDRIVVILGSGGSEEQHRYAIFTSTHEELVSSENIEYLNKKVASATIVFGALHKAMLLADFEADQLAEDPETGTGCLPGILVHHLATCRISPDTFIVVPI